MQTLPPEAAAALLREADRLFDAGDRAAAAPLYAHLAEAGPPDPRVAARHAEALLGAGRAADALTYLRGAAAKIELDAWGVRALAHAESAAGDAGRALSLAAEGLAARPDDFGFVTTFLEMQERHGDLASWRAALTGAALTELARRELACRLALAEGRPKEAGAVLLADAGFAAHDRLYYLALQTAYAALEAGDADLAGLLAGRLDGVGPDEVAAILLRTELALYHQRYEDAAAALGRVPPDRAGRPEIRLKWFELACFTGDFLRARELLAGMEADGPLPHQAVPSVLRFFAEQQAWDEVLARAHTWLDRTFRFSQIGYVLFRAARRTGRGAALRAAIEAVEGWRAHADLARLHLALAWDGARSAAEMEVVAAGAQASPAMRHRMAVQARVMARARPPGGRRAVFSCADAAFLAPTLVALHSALEHADADAFLVVPDALVASVEPCAAAFRAAGHRLTAVPAGAVVPAGEKLDPGYGLFTSGLVLSAAAYWRIFAAGYMRRLGVYGRALYLDGDVLVRRSLAPLFEADLGGHPLGARVEAPRPEVVRATALHGLAEGGYFNSGVLLFDLLDPSLAAALERSVGVANDDGVTKMFHDQCALNLGFRDRFARLPAVWNMPVNERMSLAEVPDNAAILHFLERPKPWSAAYDGPCGALWSDSWARTADVIGAEAAVELLEMAGD